METLRASTQYDDWRGTAAADDSHDVYMHNYLTDKGLIGDNAYVVAIQFYTGENFDKPWVRALIADGTGHDDVKSQLEEDPVRLKELQLDLEIAEFFALFKRFSIVLTSRDLGLDGREYQLI